MTGMEHAIDRAAERPAILDSADSFAGGDPVNDLAILLMRTWGEAEPNSSVSRYPCCHVATFADMARAVQAAGLLAPAPLREVQAEAWAECSQWHAEQGMPVNGAATEHNPYRQEATR